MIITCSNCNTKYTINKNALGNNGKKVKCSNCNHEWFQKLNIKKKLKVQSKNEDNVKINYFKDHDNKKLFPSEIKEKKNYKFLYLVLLISLILFIYLNKKNFNYLIENHILKLIKTDFLISEKRNSFDLFFSQIEKEVSVLNNNQKVVKIIGKISNTSNVENYKIPKMKASLIDSSNNIVTSWFFSANQEKLGPQESLNFNTSYIHDDEDFVDIKIEFYKEDK
tara:strand:+ start:56 stop:724 length:669 start_codon:yes stop_codon:yes gene_type:complete